nr:N-acetylglucosamine-1-phosphodiester alpha-N-acetylglucosaminidase-like isoform X3 [Crassostrea gigas]
MTCIYKPSTSAILLHVFGILFLLSSSILSATIRPNLCRQSDGSMYCCTGYYLTENGCQECVGSVGLNCSLPCPPEYFGPKCASLCQCTKDECDAKFGCPKDMKTTMKIFKISALSQTVPPNIISENFFQKLSLANWVLIFSTAIVIVSVAIGCIIFVGIKVKKKERRNQNELSPEIELKEKIET